MKSSSGFKKTLIAGASVLAAVAASSASAQAPDQQQGESGTIVVTAQRQAYVGDFPVQDIPQNVQSLSGSVLKNLGVTRLDGALDLVSGVSHMNNFGGLWDAYSFRGFAGDANNVPSGFLVNGFAARGFSGPRDASSVERIDVLKGPTSALFGRGEPGGTVNIVTRKPEFTRKGSVQIQGGSWNNYRIDADFTSPVTDNFAIRVNGAYENAESYRDTVHTKKIFLTPSMLWKISDKTSISYELEFASQKIPFDRGIPIYNNDFSRIPPSRYLGEPSDAPVKLDTLGHQVQLQHDFNDHWSLLVGGAYRTTHLIGIQEVAELVASRQPFLVGPTAGTILSRQRRFTDAKTENIIGRAEITGHFDVAGMANTLVVGIDYDYFKFINYQTRSRPPIGAATADFSNPATMALYNAINVFNPVYGAYPAPNANANFVYNRWEKDFSWGSYFYDQIDLTPWLKIRAGGRFDNFRQHYTTYQANGTANVPSIYQNVNRFSPQGGIVVQPTETLSFYGSYGKGFRPNNGADFYNQTFKPETSESYEVGAKFLSANKKISATLAFYTMSKTNILTSDPNPDHAGFVIAVGGARSKGIEFDVNAKLPYGFNLIASYAYTDAYWTSNLSDPDFQKPILAGDPLIGVSKNSGNALLTKDFTIGDGRKATIGGGVQYIDKRLGETAANYYLPSATLVRVIGSVDLTDKLRVSGNVDNLFNIRWFANSYSALWTYPGSPRSFSIRANYRF
ncbi:MAG TPA: TonB-dependent receptor [Sphingobium sp.]|uniref:TonB-dependent siderophore receptor n=1 Tax=Sphingobium sp. TaxID=1912891 RepID=UPI002ED3A0D4